MAAGEGRKRKRPEADADAAGTAGHRRPKQPRTCGPQESAVGRPALLARYFPKIESLRAYVLARLPASSKIRRKKIASLGQGEPACADEQRRLSRLLDSTLVAVREDAQAQQTAGRWASWLACSEQAGQSHVSVAGGPPGARGGQSKVVDFVVGLLFKEDTKQNGWPKNLLADGFRRTVASKPRRGVPVAAASSVSTPEIYAVHPNRQVQILKADPWPQLLSLLGKAGERIMIDLLLDCSIFLPVEAGQGNYYQLTGLPLFDQEPLGLGDSGAPVKKSSDRETIERSPSQIVFVKSRMLYARAALSTRGLVHFGLRHIHVLNRFPHHTQQSTAHDGSTGRGDQPGINEQNTVRVMMYMFPRQFGLHNVFTSAVERPKTAQKFPDYTLREEEIANKFGKGGDAPSHILTRVPKRLRGSPTRLVERLQILHGRCSYSQLLRHHCPAAHQVAALNETRATSVKNASSCDAAQLAKPSRPRRKTKAAAVSSAPIKFSNLSELATPAARVSAFCQAVLKKIIPDEFWGVGETQSLHRAAFLKAVDHFVKLRRFETMNLHELTQGMKMADIEWLAPPGLGKQRMSQTDLRKRTEIFHEFLYYIVDSLLIPLIRNNFYVTESKMHTYKMLFFRHDVWRYVAEPAMAALKTTMLEEVKMQDALRLLDSRQLGFSRVRLLPKETSMRPIMNLRRRAVGRGARKTLGPSINTILGPVHAMLSLEKTLQPERLGSAMFSVGDMYKSIKEFAQRVKHAGQGYYLAKVDVQSAFDTIPQEAVLHLMQELPSHRRYKLLRHVELQASHKGQAATAGTGPAMIRRWRSSATGVDDLSSFLQKIEEQLAPNRNNTVFAANVFEKVLDTRSLLALMASHVRGNLVKIGKKYYRQKEGIPQGSVLSSMLCNYFYADLEITHFGFLRTDDHDCLLLRLIDDFLLITTDRSKAAKFVNLMHGGLPAYGVRVNPGKSLVNFDLVAADGTPVPRLQSGDRFPYCGTLLDCRTLEIAKNREAHATGHAVFDSLTVEFSRAPGGSFKKRVLNAFKANSHMMFFDTCHNTSETTSRNMYEAFSATATKMWAYARCLPRRKKPSSGLVIDTIQDLIRTSFLLLVSKSRKSRYPGYQFSVDKSHVSWLALAAFRRVLVKKQTGYTEVLGWLRHEMQQLGDSKNFRVPAGVSI